MSSTTTPTTFVDLYTDVLNNVRGDTGRSADVVIAKRLVNKGLQDLHIQEPWPWDERRDYIRTHAPYITGSVSIASTARTALVGTGTLWNTAVGDDGAGGTAFGSTFTNLRPTTSTTIAGAKIVFGGDSEVYRVTAVSSDTAATITPNYIGHPTVASTYVLAYGAYSAFEDEYTLASDFWRLVDIRSFSDAMPIDVLARQDFYRLHPVNKSTGTPRACTIIDVGTNVSVAPLSRVVFYPVPDEVYSIPYRYRTTHVAVSTAGVTATALSADADEPIIPLRYRHALVYFALSEWYRDRKDDTRSGEALQAYVDLVKRMKSDTIPERDVPRLLGARRRYLSRAAGPRRISGGRFSTGSAWDEMRE